MWVDSPVHQQYNPSSFMYTDINQQFTNQPKIEFDMPVDSATDGWVNVLIEDKQNISTTFVPTTTEKSFIDYNQAFIEGEKQQAEEHPVEEIKPEIIETSQSPESEIEILETPAEISEQPKNEDTQVVVTQTTETVVEEIKDENLLSPQNKKTKRKKSKTRQSSKPSETIETVEVQPETEIKETVNETPSPVPNVWEALKNADGKSYAEVVAAKVQEEKELKTFDQEKPESPKQQEKVMKSFVQICVVEAEEEITPEEPLVEVDADGFIEFVPKKELRDRRSRSRSRSKKQEDKSQERKEIISEITTKSGKCELVKEQEKITNTNDYVPEGYIQVTDLDEENSTELKSYADIAASRNEEIQQETPIKTVQAAKDSPAKITIKVTKEQEKTSEEIHKDPEGFIAVVSKKERRDRSRSRNRYDSDHTREEGPEKECRTKSAEPELKEKQKADKKNPQKEVVQQAPTESKEKQTLQSDIVTEDTKPEEQLLSRTNERHRKRSKSPKVPTKKIAETVTVSAVEEHKILTDEQKLLTPESKKPKRRRSKTPKVKTDEHVENVTVTVVEDKVSKSDENKVDEKLLSPEIKKSKKQRKHSKSRTIQPEESTSSEKIIKTEDTSTDTKTNTVIQPMVQDEKSVDSYSDILEIVQFESKHDITDQISKTDIQTIGQSESSSTIENDSEEIKNVLPEITPEETKLEENKIDTQSDIKLEEIKDDFVIQPEIKSLEIIDKPVTLPETKPAQPQSTVTVTETITKITDIKPPVKQAHLSTVTITKTEIIKKEQSQIEDSQDVNLLSTESKKSKRRRNRSKTPKEESKPTIIETILKIESISSNSSENVFVDQSTPGSIVEHSQEEGTHKVEDYETQKEPIPSPSEVSETISLKSEIIIPTQDKLDIGETVSLGETETPSKKKKNKKLKSKETSKSVLGSMLSSVKNVFSGKPKDVTSEPSEVPSSLKDKTLKKKKGKKSEISEPEDSKKMETSEITNVITEIVHYEPMITKTPTDIIDFLENERGSAVPDMKKEGIKVSESEPVIKETDYGNKSNKSESTSLFGNIMNKVKDSKKKRRDRKDSEKNVPVAERSSESDKHEYSTKQKSHDSKEENGATSPVTEHVDSEKSSLLSSIFSGKRRKHKKSKSKDESESLDVSTVSVGSKASTITDYLSKEVEQISKESALPVIPSELSLTEITEPVTTTKTDISELKALLSEAMEPSSPTKTEPPVEYDTNYCLSIDSCYWFEKPKYDDAEREWQLYLAELNKKEEIPETITIQNEKKPDKDDDDSDSSGGPRSPEQRPTINGSAATPSAFNTLYTSSDLPGGMCSWKDESTYLSPEPVAANKLTDYVNGLDDDLQAHNLSQQIAEDVINDLDDPSTPISSPYSYLGPKSDQHDYTPSPREEQRRLAHQKKNIAGELENLQLSLTATEIAVSRLPSDTLQNMLTALLIVVQELKIHETEANRLENSVRALPYDGEAQILGAHLAGIRTRIVTLLSQAEQGTQTIQVAQAALDKRNREVGEYQQLLTEIEIWLRATKEFLLQEVELNTEEQVKNIIEKHKKIQDELQEKEAQLIDLTQLCDDLQRYPDVQQLALVLSEQLKTIRLILIEHKQIVHTKIETLLVYLVKVQEQMASLEADKTLNSSPMPEEELIHSPVKQATAAFLMQEQKPTVCAVETQTSQSLTAPPVQKTVETKDISITCHPPIDMEVQTEFSSSSEAKPPSKESIKIVKTVIGGEETIQISSKPVQSTSQPIIEEPDDLIVQAEYNDQQENEHKISELNIEHSAPFETVFVEPDETTTEVIVDADGTRRIIVKKLRRTVVSRHQTLQQQQLTSMNTLTEGDVPINQSFSQVTLQGQQSNTTVARGDGTKEILSSQNFGGRVVSNVPGGELNVQEFQMEPQIEYTVIEGEKPSEVEVQGIKIHEGDITYVDDKKLSLIPPDSKIIEGEEIHTSSSSVRAVVQQVTRRIIRKTRRIIKRVTIIDGKEHVTEEVVEEPEEIDVTETEMPRVSINVIRTENGQIVQQTHESKPDFKEPEISTTITKKVTEITDVTGQQRETVTEQGSPSLSYITTEFITGEQTEHTPQMFSTEAPTAELKSPEPEASHTTSSIITEFIVNEQGDKPVSDDRKIIDTSSPELKKEKNKKSKPKKSTDDKDDSDIPANPEKVVIETITTVDQASSPITVEIQKSSQINESTSPIIIKSITPEEVSEKVITEVISPAISEKSETVTKVTTVISPEIHEVETIEKIKIDQASSPIKESVLISPDVVDQACSPIKSESSSQKSEPMVKEISSPVEVKSDVYVSPLPINLIKSETSQQPITIDQASSPIKESVLISPDVVDQACSPIKSETMIKEISSPVEVKSDVYVSPLPVNLIKPETPQQPITIDQASSPVFESSVVESTTQMLIDQASSPIQIHSEVFETPKKSDMTSIITQFITAEQVPTPEIATSSEQPIEESELQESFTSESIKNKGKKQKRKFPTKDKPKIPGTPKIQSPVASVEEDIAVVGKIEPIQENKDVKAPKQSQTVEIQLSVEEKPKSEVSVTPKVAVSMKVEKTDESAVSEIVKKEVDVQLPKTTKEVHDIKTTTSVALSPIVQKTESDSEERSHVSDIDHGGRRSKKKKKHKDKSPQEESPAQDETTLPDESVASTVISPDGDGNERIEEVSVETSLAESTEIIIAGGESLLSDTPKPTEEIFDSFTSREPDISDRTNDTGYEPDDKTTVDELTISEGEDDADKKKKRKKKRKQKIKVKGSEESEVPKSLEDSTPIGRTDDDEPEKPIEPDTKKGKKKKRGKKDDGKESEPEIESVDDIKPPTPKEKTPTPEIIPIPEITPEVPKSPEQKRSIEGVISPDESYRTISEIYEPGDVKIIEENIISSPQSETMEITTQVVTTVPILETTYTMENIVQTSPDLSEPVIIEKKEEIQPVCVEHISAQTSPEVPKETSTIITQTDEEPDTPKPETTELSIQVETKEIIPATEEFSQTSTPEKLEQVITTETEMQTVTPEKVEVLEESIQTISPEVIEVSRTESAMQTTVVESQDELIQTLSPEPIPIVETSEITIQTEKIEEKPQSIQTSPEPQIITSEQSMQTLSPEPEVQRETIVEKVVEIEPPVITKAETTETVVQTTPVVIREVGEEPVSKSPDVEGFEIQIQTTVSVPGKEQITPTKTVVVESTEEETKIVQSPQPNEIIKEQLITTSEEPSSIESSTTSTENIMNVQQLPKIETIKSVDIPINDSVQATINLLKAEDTVTESDQEPSISKSKKSKHKKKPKDHSTKSETPESSEQDYSINITVQGVPVDQKFDVHSFIETERQQSEAFISSDKSKKKSKPKKGKSDKKRPEEQLLQQPKEQLPSQGLLDPRPSYSEVAKRNSRSSSPVDETRKSPESETEPSSVIVGKVITDLDKDTVKLLGERKGKFETWESKDSDSSTLVASDSGKELSPSPDTSTGPEPIKIEATITAPVHDIESLTIEIKDQEPIVVSSNVIQSGKSKPVTVKPKSKGKYTASVTIEEVMSPTEIVDAPLTPSSEGPLSPPNLNYPSTTATWAKPDSHRFIETEKYEQHSIHPEIPSQDTGIKWKQTSALERVKNLQNARKTTHLSDVLYLATLNEVVTEESIQQKNNDVQENLNVLKQAVAKQDIVVIQQTIITTVETITTWLETIEYRIYLNRQQTSQGPSEERVKELGDLKEEIVNIEQSVGELEGALRNAGDLCNEDDKNKIEKYINSLQQQIKVIEEVTSENEQQAAQDLTRWLEFLNGVNNVSRLVNDVKLQLDTLVESDFSPSRKLQELEQIETSNRCHMLKTVHLLNAARGIMRDFPSREVPQEMYTAHELTRHIDHVVNSERDKALQLLSLADEYVQTLKEFAQITDIADALVESNISVTDLEHLQEEMQKHRKFFVNLSHCRAILESLEGNLDSETRALHSNLHRSLHERATIILDKAASRAQQMALAASRWTVLEQGMRDETRWLLVAQQRVPDLSTVTSADYDQYINLYQSLSLDIAHHHAKLAQLNSVAQKLQELITCVGLEQIYGDALQDILKLQEDVNNNLKRLNAFRETWSQYNILTDNLEYWMREAEQELANIDVPSGPKLSPQMKQFWELKAQYEVHNNIRNESGKTFEQAMSVVPVADEMLQRQFRSELQDRWQIVSTKINDIQTAVIENISAPDVPINEKLNILEDELHNLKIDVDDLHGIIKNEEELNLYIERLQVMSTRIETIQNELGRLGLLSATESEKVGSLLALSRRLEIQISEELEGANLLKDKLHAIKRGLSRVRRNHQKVNKVLDDCESCEKLGSDVVEKAVNDCQEMGEELVAHWQDLMGLRQLLHTLPMRLRLSVSPVKVEREISQLQDEHTALERRCGHLLALLRNRLALWHRFEHQLEIVQQSVQEADYMMELLTIQGTVDYDRLKKATERLEGLNSNFTSREQLVSELQSVAEPLKADCSPEVTAKVEAAVQEAVTAWQDTCTNLRDLCTRYQDAVKLWKQYRDASDVVRTWADQQMGTVKNLKPEEALKEVKVCEETLAAHMERLAELRGLVAQIAADVGLDAGGLLQGDVEALGQRLQDVRETLTTLADVAESREECNGELNNTKTFLNKVHKSLTDVDKSNDENCEQQLVALRNHLLALGKTENQIQNLKDKSIEMTQSTRTETSVIEVLELWQKVFRETFHQYHRLSTRLVKSQDSAVALKLWQEYLLHVQQFLSASIPEDFNSLTEHQHLCQVHQNLLTTQQNVLLQKASSDISAGDSDIIEQFNMLTGLHNETLSRIVERHDQVSGRLASWEQYRRDQSKLLSWLKEMEKERGRLQLRYIHIRRVSKVLTRIQSLLDKVPSGEEQIQNLQQQQSKLLMFCDDALATSIRMEHSAMSQRISNLQAALETWKEFLLRILELSKNYDERVDKIQTVFQEIQEVITNNSQDVPVFHSGIQSRLDNLRMVRTRVSDLTRDLEELGVTQEELKECVSPTDMKTINQRLWLLLHQQGDLDHQLAMLCHHLEEKSGLKNMFEARQSRFMTWANEVESRLNEKSEAGTIIMRDPEDVLRKLETELQSEMVLKEREVEWLVNTSQELLRACGQDDQEFRSDISVKIEEVEESWQRLQNLGKTKANKLHDIIQTMSQLEIRIAEIRAWLYQIESQLAAPLVFEACTKDVIDKKLQEHEKLKKSIEKESANVAEVLNLCELLLSDVDTWKVHFNTENITNAIDGLEKRWKSVCGISAERKRRIQSVWSLLQEVIRLSKQQEEWLKSHEIQLQEIESKLGKQTQEQIQESIYKVESLIKEIESRGPTLEILEQSYSKLAKASGLEPDNLQQLTSSVKIILTRWYALTPKAMDILQKLQRELTLYREFITAHGKAVVSLTQVDVQLTQLQHLATPEQTASPEKRLQQIVNVEQELQSFDDLLKSADKLGLMVMQKCRKEEISSIQEMIDEYQLLWKDIQERISLVKQEVELQVKEQTKKTEVDESVQVETLKFEQDTAVQVNTLPPLVRMTSITSKDAYIYELETAITECTTNINALEAIVNSPIPQQGSPEIHTSGRTLAKLIATCQSSVELIKHLNTLLITECNATEEEARSEEVHFLSTKFNELLVLAKAREQKIRELRSSLSDAYSFICEHEAGRLLCPLCTRRNWQQLDNDLWRLEKWLQFAEGTQSSQHTPPSHIEQLEDVIQDHREFLLDLDSHKSIVVSLNIVGTHLADHTEDTTKADELRERLATDNKRWDSVCRNAAAWQTLLQRALMDNRQFHQTIDELCIWLEQTETTIRASEPVDLTADVSIIDAKYLKFCELRAELERCEPRVMSLQEAADQLLRNEDSPEGSSVTYTRLTDLRLRLQSLRRLTGVYILKLGAVLGRDPNEIVTLATPASSLGTSLHSLSYDLLDQASTSEVDHAPSTDQPHTGTGDEEEINTSVLTRGYRFLGRVVRASLPIQALMLLLLGVASLVPTGEDDYSCTLTNNFARSFEPMLRYPNGPPPI